MRLVHHHLRLAWLGGALLIAPAVARAQDPAPKPAESPSPTPTPAPTPAPAPAPAPAPDKPADPPVAKREPAPPAPATVPATRPGAWMQQHEKFLDRGKKGPVDLLFLGDSITAGWNGAREIWTRSYAPRQAANFGIGGDRTQHILWRLDNGEVDAIRPKVVVLMIGTNNVGSNPEAEVADGVGAILDRLKAKLPATKVLLLGLFPRGSNRDKTVPSVAARPPDRAGQRPAGRLRRRQDGQVPRHRRRLPRRRRQGQPGHHARLPPPHPGRLPDLGRRDGADPLEDARRADHEPRVLISPAGPCTRSP